MAFPPRFLEELRARLPVSQIVGRRVKLVRHGREHTGLCPFHSEKTPSFTVNDDKSFYHCFGCGAHGDVITFVRETEGLEFVEAVERLAAEAGVEVPQESPQERAAASQRAGLHEVMGLAADWYTANLPLPAGAAAWDYLRQRGLDNDTIGRFRLGFAPSDRGALTRHLAAHRITPQQLIACGLIKPGEDGSPDRDYFFNRIIFPITDRRGRIIAFGGRGLGDAKPKYLNSPDTELFHKGHVLYNIDRAAGAARTAAAGRTVGTVIVAEGYMDVIALAQAGFANAVAPLGTALTEAQLAELWRHADEPLLCFDGDNAGRRAALRAAARALPGLAPGKSIRFVPLPSGQDPDDLIRSGGPDAMKSALAAAIPLVGFLWDHEVAAAPLDTPERRADLEKRLDGHVGTIEDRAVGFQYRSEFRARLRRLLAPPFTRPQSPSRLGANRSGFGRRFGSGFSGGATMDDRVAASIRGEARPNTADLRRDQDLALIAMLLNRPALLERHFEALGDIALSSPELDKALRELLNLAALGQDLDSALLHRHFSEHGFANLLEKVENPGFYQRASFAGPDAPVAAAESAMVAILAAHGRQRAAEERTVLERELAQDMTEAGTDRLRGLTRQNSGVD